MQINNLLSDEEIDTQDKLHMIYYDALSKLGKKLTDVKMRCLKGIIEDPYVTRTELVEKGFSPQVSSDAFRILRLLEIVIPKGPKCGARLRAGGFCKTHIRPGGTFCKLHKDKAIIHFEPDAETDNLFEQLWVESLELIGHVPDITLNQLLGSISEALLDEHDMNVSIRRLQKWYRRTQGEKGHPTWIMDRKYVHYTGKTPYYDVWKGSPQRKNSRERIIEYAKEHPDATIGETAKAVGTNYERVKKISNQEELKLRQPRKEVY